MSNFARRMSRLSAQIFGEVVRNTSNKSMRVVKLFSEKPLDLRPEVVDYYPPHDQYTSLMSVLRDHGLFRDEHLDFNEEMLRLRKLRGKVKVIVPGKKDKDPGAPKKSKGKRKGKKK